MKTFRRIVAAFLPALPVSYVAVSARTVTPASAEGALFTCTPLGLGSQGYVYACEGWNGEKWLYIAK
jgi:hypothetical protein